MARGNYWWEEYDKPVYDVVEWYAGTDPEHTMVAVMDVTTSTTVWSNEDTYVVDREGDRARRRAHELARDERRRPSGRWLRFTRAVSRQGLPSVLTCARVVIGVTALIGFVSHLRGGGVAPCTCPHP
jgi:hypothetical protein